MYSNEKDLVEELNEDSFCDPADYIAAMQGGFVYDTHEQALDAAKSIRRFARSLNGKSFVEALQDSKHQFLREFSGRVAAHLLVLTPDGVYVKCSLNDPKCSITIREVFYLLLTSVEEFSKARSFSIDSWEITRLNSYDCNWAISVSSVHSECTYQVNFVEIS
jgi:hypothetical protein